MYKLNLCFNFNNKTIIFHDKYEYNFYFYLKKKIPSFSYYAI